MLKKFCGVRFDFSQIHCIVVTSEALNVNSDVECAVCCHCVVLIRRFL